MPPTAQAPEVSRQSIYSYRGDPDYKGTTYAFSKHDKMLRLDITQEDLAGGADVNELFLKRPCIELMFAHKFDAYVEGYVEQTFNLPISE